MGEDCDGKCRDQFPGYLELVQKRKLVCGLARSVIRCFLGSGVLPPNANAEKLEGRLQGIRSPTRLHAK